MGGRTLLPHEEIQNKQMMNILKVKVPKENLTHESHFEEMELHGLETNKGYVSLEGNLTFTHYNKEEECAYFEVKDLTEEQFSLLVDTNGVEFIKK